jgi:hypothetical protein
MIVLVSEENVLFLLQACWALVELLTSNFRIVGFGYSKTFTHTLMNQPCFQII